MSSSNTVMACRLCLATDIKLVEIEMGLRNSVKSMLGENVYYTSGLPSHVCFECAAQLRKYTKFRRKCRRVQTYLYGILKNNGEVTEEELKKINRQKLGLESSLSIRIISSESFHEPTETIKEEVVDTDLDLATEHDIDIKIEEPRIAETYDEQEYEDMPLVIDAKTIECDPSWVLANQELCTQQQFVEYMSTFGKGPYLKERNIKDQKTTETFTNSVNHHILNETGECLFPNITLPVCTTITPVRPSQSVGCKKCLRVFTPGKFSEHVRYCKQDANELHALKNLGLTILPEQNIEIINQVQVSDHINKKNIATSNLKIDKPLLQVTVTEKKLQSLNRKYCKVKNKITFNKRVNEKKVTSNMIGDCTINKVTRVSNLNDIANAKQKGKKNKDVTTTDNLKNRKNVINNTNNEEIDVNTYMEAIELLPYRQIVKLEDQNITNNSQGIGDFRISKIETLTNKNDMENNLKKMSKNVSKVSNTNIYNINRINLKFDKAIAKDFNKGSNLEKSHIVGQGIQIIEVKTENNIGKIGNKSVRVKKKRKRPYDSEDDDTNQTNVKTGKRRKKLTQRRWSKEEMEIVYRRFHTELDLKQNPGVVKCKLVLKEEPLLQGRTWMQLNSCVNNLYMKKVKSRVKENRKLEESGRLAEFHSNLTLPSQVLAMRKLPSGEL